jgi:hypothetical protein
MTCLLFLWYSLIAPCFIGMALNKKYTYVQQLV